MLRVRHWVAAAGVGAAAALVLIGSTPSHGQAKQKWVTIKGQIVWPGKVALPDPKKPDIKTDKEHCLAKGDLFYEDLQVNKKNRGVKHVWVYLKPAAGEEFAAGDINPALAKAESKKHTIDQPCCQFVPRVLAARAGDTVTIKNSAPVPHNVNYSADNDAFNNIVQPGGQVTPKPLEAQRTPIIIKCDIHPWMGGRIVVFDHPYFAVTDENGAFEIKDAPVGKFRIFYRHENGFHKGQGGGKGFPIDIKDEKAGTMELKPLDLELPKPLS